MGTMRFNWATKLKLAEVCCSYAGAISTLPSPWPPSPLPLPTAFSWSAVLFWKLCESSSRLHHTFHLTLILQIITGISKKISRQEHLWLLSIKPKTMLWWKILQWPSQSLELQVNIVVHSSLIMSSVSVSGFISLVRQVNKLALSQWRLLHPYVYVHSRLNLEKTCSYGTNAGNSLRKIRTSIWLPCRVLTASSFVRRSYSNDDNGKKKTGVAKGSPSKKQIKSEDLFRILSLAKPEYKSLAGKPRVIPSG